MSDKKMSRKKEKENLSDEYELDGVGYDLGEFDVNLNNTEDDPFLEDVKQTISNSKVKNTNIDSLGRKKSTIFKEEYERSILKEEKRKRILREGFEAMDNSDDLNSNYVPSDFNAKYSDLDKKPSVSTFELQEDKDKPVIQEEENTVITQKNEFKNENTKENISSTTEMHKEEKNSLDNSDDLNSNYVPSDFNAKYSDLDKKPSVSTFELQEDKDKPVIQEEENTVITQKNEFKNENTKENISSTIGTHEEEKNNPYIHLNVGRNLDRCLESLDKYKEERESKFNIAYTSSDFKKLGLNVFNTVLGLMYNLSNPDLQIISVDGDNLSVELCSQKSNLNLKKLKELFLSIRKFSSDYDMYKFTTDQSDDMFKYHKNIHSNYSCFKKFKQKCSEKNISNKNLNEIDDVFVDLRKMYCGKTYTYGKNNPKDNQTPLSDSFRKKVKQYNNIKKFFIGLTRKFEDLTRKVFRKLEDFNRKVGKKSVEFIYGSESFRRDSGSWERWEQTRKEKREKEDLARKEKRDREDQEMENGLAGRTAVEVLEEINKDITRFWPEEKENSLTSSKAFKGADMTTADEMSKKTNEDIAKMEKNRSRGQNSGLNFSSN